MRWSLATQDKARSQSGSGAVCFGIVQREVVALRVRITSVGAADTRHFVEQGVVGQDRPSQFGPVIPVATRDHIVDGGEGEALMVEVSMAHGGQ